MAQALVPIPMDEGVATRQIDAILLPSAAEQEHGIGKVRIVGAVVRWTRKWKCI